MRKNAILAFGLLVSMTAFSGGANAQSQVFHLQPDRYVVKGNAAMEDGKFEDALVNFRKAVRKNLSAHERITTYNSICAVENILDHHVEAQQACDQAIAEDSGYWRAYVNRGSARLAQGDAIGAVADFCRARDLSPNSVGGAFEARCDSIG